MKPRPWLSLCRGAAGLLALAALAFQYSVSCRLPNFKPLNFFAYFTNLSNLLAAAIVLRGAVRSRATAAVAWTLWRGAAVLCMTLTGVVFTLLLSNVDVLVTPAVNVVVHYVMPLAVLADWLVDPPPTPLTTRQGLAWLGLPLVYAVGTLVRGHFIHWYPYPFLSPQVVGYGGVLIYGVIIALGLVLLAWGIVRLGNFARAVRARATGGQ